MSKKEFQPEELILVDVENRISHEKWVPAIYVGQADVSKHYVKVWEDGFLTERVYPEACLKHADEAIEFKVRYEVYVDVYGSAVEYFDTYAGANKWAEELANKKQISPTFAIKDDIVVDKVLIGGYRRVNVYHPRTLEDA